MNRRTWLKSILPGLIFRPLVTAQSRAYVKFGSGGETVGLYNLMKRGVSCGFWQIFEGTVTGVGVEKKEAEAEYRRGIEERMERLAGETGLGGLTRDERIRREAVPAPARQLELVW